MKKILLTAMAVAPFFCLAQYTYKNLDIHFTPTPIEIATFSFDNLRLYPVYAKESFQSEFKTVGKYVTLQEAIQKNKVRITEKSKDGTVNTLSVENISTDTVLIVTGDVVKGGKQDRIINKDLLLKPKSGKKDLPVFCVESGRWSGSSNGSLSSRNYTPAEFKGYYNKGSMSLRKVVEKEQDQSKVWQKVDELNSSNKTNTSTKTYTALNNSAAFNKKLQQYINFFQNKFNADKKIIGVVVVSGNKVLGCDMFATHTLFTQQFQSLLHSYATEAILNGKPIAIAPVTVKAYVDKLLVNEETQSVTLKEKGNSFTEKGKKLRVSSFE